jgi:translocation and assembly module TamB
MGGTLGEPRFNGEFEISDGRFEFYRTNFILADAHLAGRFEGDELGFQGRGTTSGGSVTLDGRFRWPEGVMNGSMRLQGDRLLVADTPEYRVVASPDLTVTANTNGYLVTGKVQIPSALIAPKDLTTSVSTSPDERIVGIDSEDDSPSTLQRIRSQIDVVLGDDVKVDSYGLKATLGGAVTVLTRPADVARGQGAINVVSGQYKAFGQDVRITRGRLAYDNTPLSQPTLDLVAERRIEDDDDGGRQCARPARSSSSQSPPRRRCPQRGAVLPAHRPLGRQPPVGRGARSTARVEPGHKRRRPAAWRHRQPPRARRAGGRKLGHR